jgi:hypothetical protein
MEIIDLVCFCGVFRVPRLPRVYLCSDLLFKSMSMTCNYRPAVPNNEIAHQANVRVYQKTARHARVIKHGCGDEKIIIRGWICGAGNIFMANFISEFGKRLTFEGIVLSNLF